MSGQGPPPGSSWTPPPGGPGQPGGTPPPYGWAAPGPWRPDPEAPFGRNPLGEPYSDKSKLAAGLLQIFVGYFGVGRWYLGDNGIALAQLLTCGGCHIWSFIDGIMILSGSVRDRYGRPLRD